MPPCWRRLLVALWLVAGVGLLPGAARAADDPEFTLQQDVTWVGRFSYDARHQTITLPISGIVPSLSWHDAPRQARFKVAYLDMPGLGDVPAHLRGGPQWRFPEDRLVRLIMLSEPRPGSVRLVVRGARPLHLAPQLVSTRQGWAIRVKVTPVGRRAKRQP